MKILFFYVFDTSKNGTYSLTVTNTDKIQFLTITFDHEYSCIWNNTVFKNPIGKLVNQQNFIRWSGCVIKELIRRMSLSGPLKANIIIKGCTAESINDTGTVKSVVDIIKQNTNYLDFDKINPNSLGLCEEKYFIGGLLLE